MIIAAEKWLRPGEIDNQSIQNKVQVMLQSIASEGDQKIIQFSQQFDQFQPEVIQLKAANEYSLSSDTLKHLKIAASRIEKFCRFQKENFQERYFEDEFGCYGQTVLAIEKIAAYIPGGRFPLASTALMTLIPAKIAGCIERIAFSPSEHPAILAAASLAGATSFVKLGGVQAVAAAAYGSEFNPQVDMIVGPGNAYVNAAKSQLQNKLKIDSQAGPSELLIIADGDSNPEWLIADMKAQAEHDPMALSVLISWDKQFLKAIESLLTGDAEGQQLIEANQIQLVSCSDSKSAISFSNSMAAEHLMLCSKQIQREDLSHYGALFFGEQSAVAMGDYCSGPNHTLPTSGFARQTGGLQVGDFLRVLSFQQLKSSAYPALAETAVSIAKLENLKNHQRSIEIRMKSYD